MKNSKNNIKKAKGITLVALVITIIIIIILASVAINFAFGENGLITMAQKAKDLSDNARIDELMNIYKLEIQMKKDDETLKDKLIRDGLVNEDELNANGIAKINDSRIAISDYNGLKKLSEEVNNGNDYEGIKIYITNDIDCGAVYNKETGELTQGDNFKPIGDSNSRISNETDETSRKTEFKGEFDGFTYTISNIYIKEEENTYCTGLFGYIGEEGIVRDLTISDSYIHGYYEVGAIAGRNRGIIENCTNGTDVIGDYHLTGGIAGRNTNTIENCVNNGNIYGGGSIGDESQTGGIVGNCDFNDNVVVNNCKNYGTVQANGYSVGGIAGGIFNTDDNTKVTVSNCENYGYIGYTENEELTYVGGIIGRAIDGEVKNCTNNGEATGYSYIGGIIGGKTSTYIEFCYNKGNVIGSYSLIGGITGQSIGGVISKCGNYGFVHILENGHYGAGGIVGVMGSNTETSRIELCFNVGEVYSLGNTTYGRQAGGIAGNVDSGEVQIKEIVNCYNLGYIHGIGNMGGIVGFSRDITLQNCYNAGKLEIETGESGTTGGIIATESTGSTISEISNNYWLDSCGASYGIGNISSDDGAGIKTDSELRQLAEMLGEAYAEDSNNINNGYPYLISNPRR